MAISYALITGVSSGIGYAAAKHFIANGWKVIATVRTEDDRRRLKETYGSNLELYIADVTDSATLQSVARDVQKRLSQENSSLDAVICNAGVCYASPLITMPIEELDRLYRINVRGVLATLQAFFPLLELNAVRRIGQKRVRIILLSSVSGRFSYPFLGAYAASKYALEALGDSLRCEMRIYPVDVVLIEPGPIQTPLWEKVHQEGDASQYVQTPWSESIARLKKVTQKCEAEGLPASAVAQLIFKVTIKGRPKARYVIGASWLTGFFIRYFPTRWVDWVVCTSLGLKRK